MPNNQYHRAGVFLQRLVPDTPTQLSLFTTPAQQAKHQAVYTAVDAINSTFGWGTITFASVGKDQSWRAKQANRSPRYTTRFEELPLVR